MSEKRRIFKPRAEFCQRKQTGKVLMRHKFAAFITIHKKFMSRKWNGYTGFRYKRRHFDAGGRSGSASGTGAASNVCQSVKSALA